MDSCLSDLFQVTIAGRVSRVSADHVHDMWVYYDNVPGPYPPTGRLVSNGAWCDPTVDNRKYF